MFSLEVLIKTTKLQLAFKQNCRQLIKQDERQNTIFEQFLYICKFFREYKSLLTSWIWLNVLLIRHLLFTFKSFMSVSDSIVCMENLIQSFIFLYGQFLGFKCIASDVFRNLEPYKHLFNRAVEDMIWVIRKH